jgi:hypothetical protein
MADFPESGQFSFSQLNTVIGYAAGAQLSLSDTNVRIRLLRRTVGSQISLGADSYRKTFNLVATQTNYNLRNAAVSAGWNQTIKLEINFTSTAQIISDSPGTPACTVTGSFPGGLSLNNYGLIIGRGGAGGNGADWGGGNGGAGGNGGTALYMYSITAPDFVIWNTPTTFYGIYAGGGGGGGGGNGSSGSGKEAVTGGGGGGGGARSTNATNISGGAGGSPGGSAGGAGTISSAGSGGAGGSGVGGSGGAGANFGSGGTAGSTGTGGSAGGSGGTVGAAVIGNTIPYWYSTGERYGGIS